MKLPAARLWGVGLAVRPFTGVHSGQAYRTVGPVADRRAHFVFRTTARSEAVWRWLVPVLEAAERAGFAVPMPLLSIRGRLVEAGWVCTPLLTADPLDEADRAHLAAPLHRFHTLTRGVPQCPGSTALVDLVREDVAASSALARLPPDLAALCREAWCAVDAAAQGVVHGALTSSGVGIAQDGRPALLDWDACRRDALFLDRIAIAPESATEAERRAALAWQVATGWENAPKQAAARARRLRLAQRA